MSSIALVTPDLEREDALPWNSPKASEWKESPEEVSEINKAWRSSPLLVISRASIKAYERHNYLAECEYKDCLNTIEFSKYILEFQNDWDEMGSPSFARDTWERATALAKKIAESANNVQHVTIGKLSVAPAHSGSIDLFWKNKSCDLLFNIPATGNLGTMYGTNEHGEIFSGALDILHGNPDLIIKWLKRT